jgi:zinc transporter 1/2/3
MDSIRLLVRQAVEEEQATSATCSSSNDYDGRMGLRISSIFVILFASSLGKGIIELCRLAQLTLTGAVFPVFAKRHRGLGVPDWAFFIAKYFGSGVIIATAFIHVCVAPRAKAILAHDHHQLLAPANEALGNECLQGVITEYPWVEGIALMTLFLMFFLELMTMRYANFEDHSHNLDHEHHDHYNDAAPRNSHQPGQSHELESEGYSGPPVRETPRTDSISLEDRAKYTDTPNVGTHHNVPGDDHLGHARHHKDNPSSEDWAERGIIPESYAAQMTGIFILEFGVIFHSIFIGLTLAVAGEEFITLYIVLVFHQMFEGLGLGARLATAPWPKSKRWTPYLLGLGYGLSTPIAIAIGLGVRKTYPPESATTLIVNGVFDSISAGILIYTGLVELMAHEFMFSPYMQKGPVSRVLGAFLFMCLGAGK